MNTDPTKQTCLHCGRDEMEVPLIAWRYQGHNMVICPDCFPTLIHRREVIMAKWSAQNTAQTSSDVEVKHAQR